MNASQHASTSLVRRLISIEEYLAAKGLVSAKLVLVPKVEPSPASLVALRLAELRFETICRNSRLLNEAAGRWDDCEGTPTTAYSGEHAKVPSFGPEELEGYGSRINDCSFRNAGRKPYRHATHLRRVKFKVKRLTS